MNLLLALSFTVSPQEGTLLDDYTLHLEASHPTEIEGVKKSLIASGNWEILNVTKKEDTGAYDLHLLPLSFGKVPLFIEPTLEGLYVKINAYDGEKPPFPPLVSMSPVIHDPLPEKEAKLWAAFLREQPENNMRIYEEKKIPWRGFFLFLGLLLTLPYLFRLLYLHVLIPLSYISPEESTLKALQELRQKPLGRERYFDLSRILRIFYSTRYAIGAEQMTSQELSENIDERADILEKEGHLSLLAAIDQQKFMNPLSAPFPVRDLYAKAEELIQKSIPLDRPKFPLERDRP